MKEKKIKGLYPTVRNISLVRRFLRHDLPLLYTTKCYTMMDGRVKWGKRTTSAKVLKYDWLAVTVEMG